MIYTDYASMQKAAQKRVYEMQRKSQQAMANAYWKNENKTKFEEQTKENDIPDVLPKDECFTVEDKHQDNERILIAALISLLAAEGTDIKTIAVLLYLLTGD